MTTKGMRLLRNRIVVINPVRRTDFGSHHDAGAYLAKKNRQKRYLRAHKLGKFNTKKIEDYGRIDN